MTTLQDGFREVCIRARVGAASLAHGARERMREERGQTAAEYMGILLLVALVIAALVQPPVDIDKKISDTVSTLVDKISKGGKPATEEG